MSIDTPRDQRNALHLAQDLPKLLANTEDRAEAIKQAYNRIASLLNATKGELDALLPAEAANLRLAVARAATN